MNYECHYFLVPNLLSDQKKEADILLQSIPLNVSSNSEKLFSVTPSY